MNRTTKRLISCIHASAKQFGINSWQSQLFLTELRYRDEMVANHIEIHQKMYN